MSSLGADASIRVENWVYRRHLSHFYARGNSGIFSVRTQREPWLEKPLTKHAGSR